MREIICLIIMFSSTVLSAATVDDVLSLAKQDASEVGLLDAVSRSTTKFDISTEDILKLIDAKISQRVIAAMIRHRPGAEALPLAGQLAGQDDGRPVEDAATLGTLNIENLDDRAWGYEFNKDARTFWVSAPASGTMANLPAGKGVRLSLPPGAYLVGYANSQEERQEIVIHARKKSDLMISRAQSDTLEALYVSIFEDGERKRGGRLVVLREHRSPPVLAQPGRQTPQPVLEYSDPYYYNYYTRTPYYSYSTPRYYSGYYSGYLGSHHGHHGYSHHGLSSHHGSGHHYGSRHHSGHHGGYSHNSGHHGHGGGHRSSGHGRSHSRH